MRVRLNPYLTWRDRIVFGCAFAIGLLALAAAVIALTATLLEK